MTLRIRFGAADDSSALADFIIQAGNGIFEQLFGGLVPGVGVKDILRLAVSDPDSCFNFSNAIVVETEGEVVGTLLGYAAERYGLPPVAETLVPRKRREPLERLLQSRAPGSYYINTVAVAPSAQGLGIGRLLVETSVGVAEQEGFASLSLHAWQDNDAAVALYRSLGFRVVEEIPVPQTKRLLHSAPVALMVASVADAKAAMAAGTA